MNISVSNAVIPVSYKGDKCILQPYMRHKKLSGIRIHISPTELQETYSFDMLPDCISLERLGSGRVPDSLPPPRQLYYYNINLRFIMFK